MNGSNMKINMKGMLQAEGKWSQMEAWKFRKETRAIEREMSVNINDLCFTKLMFKIKRIKIHDTIALESGRGANELECFKVLLSQKTVKMW